MKRLIINPSWMPYAAAATYADFICAEYKDPSDCYETAALLFKTKPEKHPDSFVSITEAFYAEDTPKDKETAFLLAEFPHQLIKIKRFGCAFQVITQE